ncbi:alpha/beta hydrolase [Galbitalea soli]|uniref:alpha/beta hydrolase n=1 Tax=Galbitalea soli TaxID=1268042 RepID=UPI0017AA7A45|nr:alpha-beta hydrolase superfamily lysophospholipase [Galbitalea soli]
MPTSVRTDHSYVDAEGVTIHYHRWDAQNPVGVVQIAHGLGEYAARYEYLAQALTAAGFTVYADDHRGHGQTGLGQYGGDRSRLGRLGPGGLRATIAALRMLTAIARDEHPDLPLAIIGHSWGSLMVQIILNRHASDYDAVILTGTAHRLPGSMNAGQLNARHKHLGDTGFEWLSRDPAVAAAFLADPLTFYADVLKLFGLADGLRLFGVPSRHLDHDVPLLIAIGSEDPLGGERSVRHLGAAYGKRSRLSDVELAVFPGARHEIFNETNRDEVNAFVIDWLTSRLVPRG